MEFQSTFDAVTLFLVHGVFLAVLFLASLYCVWHVGCFLVGKCIRVALREVNLYKESAELKHFMLLHEDEKREHIQ